MKLAVANANVPAVAGLLALLAPSLSPKPAEASAQGLRLERSLASLVTLIVDRHHVHTRSELDRLGAFGTSLGGIDAALPGVRIVLDLFTALASELRAHMTKEEAVVFPYIVSLEAHLLAGRSPVRSPFGVLDRPLRVMLDEQCQTRSLLATIRGVSQGYEPPPGASKSIVDFYRGLEALDRDLAEHGRLETEFLFPRALELEQRAHG